MLFALSSTPILHKRAGLFLTTIVALLVHSTACAVSSENANFFLPTNVSKLLNSNCYDCHDADTMKGKIQLDNLGKLDLEARLDLLNRVQEQIYTNLMPPKDKLQASDAENLLKWVSSELAVHKASKLEDKLRYYKYANYINHEKLFSGEIKDMPFTPARRWRINELIYQQLVYDIFGMGNKKALRTPFYDKFKGVVQPFNLPAESGVKYYDTEIVESGEFLTLLDNAKYIVGKQLISAVAKTDGYEAPPPPKNRFAADGFKPDTAPEFEKIILSKSNIADADLEAAITLQFKLAYQRPPTTKEMAEYLDFMKKRIKTSGAKATLEKMMISVLMGVDFLYRSELGDGNPDAYGRTKLTPREASYALSYALTDRVPDEALIQAAHSGKLSTKEDYRREVLRMLNDDELDKSRILRFFQDYFGYYQVFSIFKDADRFGSPYNPHRASSRTFRWRVPGKVSQEADLLVMSILKEDKDVIKQLLTTDKYFVHHKGDNEAMTKLANASIDADKKYRVAYEKLKGLKGNELKNAQKNVKVDVERKFLGHIIEIFNPDLPDRTPLPYYDEPLPFAISMYNLDPKTWSYEPVQPFKIKNRMGILTHPAWLISFAHNAETDPIKRGKWIQEKLLSGIIPDVPVSVEAKVPEAHDQTLRQRISSVTEEKYCWSCHNKMNPLGYPFEIFDDFGRYRTEEKLEHEESLIKTVREVVPGFGSKDRTVNYYKTLPVLSTGTLAGTGDKNLDGDVKDAFDLIERLGKSERVRQSFIRNVFRYFMGRNEMLSDSKTLIEADKAYVESGGSFKALMVSLLTSDSFIYRK